MNKGCRHSRIFPVLLVGFLAAGCETYYPSGSSRAAEEASAREDALLLQEEIRQTKGRVEDLTAEVESLRMERERGGGQQMRSIEDRLGTLREQQLALERRMQTLEATQQRDKQEIIDKLTDRITQIMQKSAPRPSARPVDAATKKRASSDSGYEHEVQPGETLSEIAKAYGVTVSVIIEANQIDRPDQLKVGQKLFIPE